MNEMMCMAIKQKKILGNLIAISFVLMIIIIIAFLSTISYTAPELPLKNENLGGFNWGDVFKINAINEYRYEIVEIKDGEIKKNEFFYDLEYEEENYKIKIFPYEGLSKKEIDASLTFDSVLYNCISKQYEGRIETCEFIFPDEEVIRGLFAVPSNMRKNVNFETVEVTTSIFRGKIYESVKLQTKDKKTTLWIVEEVPLPVRIEYNDGSNIQIANLKNYN